MRRIKPATRLTGRKPSISAVGSINSANSQIHSESAALRPSISRILAYGIVTDYDGGVVGPRLEFAEIPEIVFVEGYAENEELGVYILDPDNRTNPGDLWWMDTTGATRLKDVNGADYTPRNLVTLATATELPTGWSAAGAQQSGLTLDPATGRLEYDGSAQSSAASDWWVVLRCGSRESLPFRIRVLRPNYVWGDNASTVNSSNGWGALTQDASVAFDTFRQANNTTIGQKTDANPAVIFITAGTYTNFDFFMSNKKAVYVLGDPSSRPYVKNQQVEFDTTAVFTAPAHTYYWKNFKEENFRHSTGKTNSNSASSLYRFYIQKCENFKQTTTGQDTWSASNQEFDGADAPNYPIILGRRDYNVANLYFWDTGGNALKHYFYLHGRPGGRGFFNNCRFLGGHDCQQIKSTLPVLYVLNCYQSALVDPTNPAATDPDTGLVYQRANILIDPINVADIQVYNNYFVLAYNATFDALRNGTQSGAIFFRARRECFGSDIPPYPQPWVTQQEVTSSLTPESFLTAAWDAGSTVIYNGGYFDGDPRLNGWPCTTATYKDPAFWADVASQPVADPDNPYTFKHYVSYCTFEWVAEDSTPRCAIRNDGTFPRYVYNTGDDPSIYVRTPSGWVERSVDFIANNTFVGFPSHAEAQLFTYDDGDSLKTTITPNPMTGSAWPRTNDPQFPHYVDVGGNGLGAATSEIPLPTWHRIGGVTWSPSGQTVLSAMADSFVSGWSAPMLVPDLATPVARLYPSGSPAATPDLLTTLNDSGGALQTKRNWHWSSKWCWDSVTHRMMAVHSGHIELDNLYATQLTVYDEATNAVVIYENPLMRTVGHCFDTNAIDVTGRRLYKWTAPYYVASAPAYLAPYNNVAGSGYVQPQLVSLDLDAITLNRASAQEGAAIVQEIARPYRDPTTGGGSDITAPACDWFPGLGFVWYHDEDLWLWDGSAWTGLRQKATNPVPTQKVGTGVALHCIGHYNPTLDGFVFGGGSYEFNSTQNYAWHYMKRDRSIVRLDDSPVCMSVNTDQPQYKACATYLPGDRRSVFFHNNGNIYLLDPLAAPGSQWTTRAAAMDPDNGSNEDRWCCTIPDYNCIAVGHFGWNGTSKIRLWRP